MTISAAPGRGTREEIVRLAPPPMSFGWSARGAIDPDGALAIIDGALGLADQAVR